MGVLGDRLERGETDLAREQQEQRATSGRDGTEAGSPDYRLWCEGEGGRGTSKCMPCAIRRHDLCDGR